jgi:trk system potassium uptake protein TrkH
MLTKIEVNLRNILNVIGFLLIVEGVFMFLGIPFALYYNEEKWYTLLVSGLITSASGGVLWLITRTENRRNLNRREAYIVVGFTWFIISLFGTLPYLISNTIPSFTDAFFETMSGFTTTGATILTDIEALPRSILFWRSLTHWIGGMGIIVLSVAILPFLGIGGMQLYMAEMPGVKKDKLHPRITATAKRLWLIYVLLTFVQTGLLMFGGMDLFEGLCHAFGTVATGGFSTRNGSIAEFSPYIQYVIIVFMVLAGTNFALHYLALHGRLKEIWKNEEYRKYIYMIAFMTGVISFAMIVFYGKEAPVAFRETLFQVVSIITTTGYITSDYLDWNGNLWLLLFVLMFIGGMAGSTGGGIKVIRQLLLFKNASQELKRTLHPHGIIPVRLNGEAVPQDIIFKVMAFFQLYIVILILGAVVMALLGLDYETAIGASIATIGNIGPGLGDVGPVGNYAFIPDFGKWFLAFMMMLGRLELFTILILLSKAFWKR